MPPRYLSLAIVTCWLATGVWLYQRDLRPRLWPGGPPPFVIDLTDEAQAHHSTRWNVFVNGKEKGYSDTSVVHRFWDDTYEMKGEYKLWNDGRIGTGEANQIMQSMYRVTQEGTLKEMQARVKIKQELKLGLLGMPDKRFQVDAKISGPIEDRNFRPHIFIKAKDLDKPSENFEHELQMKPVPVSTRGSVLNPLQPLNRLPNLRPGQQWDMPVVNPLMEVVKELAKAWAGAELAKLLEETSAAVPVLRARVCPEIKILRWGRDQEETPCLVIEYEGEDIRAWTWVRASDGLVLKQEIEDREQHLVLMRE